MSEKNVNFVGKVAKFPKNTKASSAYKFLENIRVSKKKLWYILIEKEDSGLQIIKYNNKLDIDLNKFVNEVKKYYIDNDILTNYINELVVDGEDKFSVIRNIPDVEIDGKKLISILVNDLLKLLYK